MDELNNIYFSKHGNPVRLRLIFFIIFLHKSNINQQK